MLTIFSKSRSRCYLFFWYYFSKTMKNSFIFVSHTIRLYFPCVCSSKLNTLLPTFNPAKSRTRNYLFFRYYFSKPVKNSFIFVSHTIRLYFPCVCSSKPNTLLPTFNPAKSRTRNYLFFRYYFSKIVKNSFIFVSHTIRLYFPCVCPSKPNTLLSTFNPAKSRTRKRDLFTSSKEVSNY